MTITYREGQPDQPAHHQLLSIAHPERNENWFKAVSTAFFGSDYVATAWDNTRLVGTIRVITDEVAFGLIADLLVDPNYRQQGIGSGLLKMCQVRFAHLHLYAEPADENASKFYLDRGFSATSVCACRPKVE